MSDPIDRLYANIVVERDCVTPSSRTARLLADGMPKIAKKLAEEALEVALEAAQGNRNEVVLESVDLLYNLCVTWAHAGIRPEEVWAEMERRERLLGIAGKLPKAFNAEGEAKVKSPNFKKSA